MADRAPATPAPILAAITHSLTFVSHKRHAHGTVMALMRHRIRVFRTSPLRHASCNPKKARDVPICQSGMHQNVSQACVKKSQVFVLERQQSHELKNCVIADS